MRVFWWGLFKLMLFLLTGAQFNLRSWYKLMQAAQIRARHRREQDTARSGSSSAPLWRDDSFITVLTAPFLSLSPPLGHICMETK